MPTWRTNLPPEGLNKGFDLRRTPASGAIHAISTCEDFVVCDTHYWHGRTCPCERTTNDEGKTIDDALCLPCCEKIGFRTHVYLSLFDVKCREHFMFECTAHAAKQLEEYKQSNGTLRGCIVYASRPKGTKNSKVVISTNAANLAKVQLPTAPDIVKALCVIWRIPLISFDRQIVFDGKIVLKTKRDPLDKMRLQPDNEIDPPSIGDIIGGNGRLKKGHAKTC